VETIRTKLPRLRRSSISCYATLMMRLNFFTLVVAGLGCTVFPTLGTALDLNSFRAQHGLAPLSVSGTLAGAAYSHAHALAGRQRLDHTGFRQRVSLKAGPAAENVAFGCATEDCVIRMWAKSGRHRANMLRRDVTSYGLASAEGGNGKRYWVLVLGN
jgi:Cysteine-rich secretory protein family